MKLLRLVLAAAAALSLSCASLNFDNPEAVRPLATVASAAYVAEGSPAQRPAREAAVAAAVGMIRLVVDSENPTQELAILALGHVDLDPAYHAALADLIRSYLPASNVDFAKAREILRALAAGMESVLPKPTRK